MYVVYTLSSLVVEIVLAFDGEAKASKTRVGPPNNNSANTRANGDVLLAYSLFDTATSPLPTHICGLFNDAVSSSDLRVSSNGKMNSE
jgi:hypothetical protein